jgi:hypothetical protein
MDFVHPVSKRVDGKVFTNCELMGPANILISGGNATSVSFNGCDVILVKQTPSLFTCMRFDDIHIIGGSFWNVTIFITPNNVESFLKMGAKIETLTPPVTPPGEPKGRPRAS